VCITGLVSALGQCSNGLRWIMHSLLAHALSHPQPLLHCPRALKPCNAHKLVSKYYFQPIVIPVIVRPLGVGCTCEAGGGDKVPKGYRHQNTTTEQNRICIRKQEQHYQRDYFVASSSRRYRYHRYVPHPFFNTILTSKHTVQPFLPSSVIISTVLLSEYNSHS